MKPAKKKCCEDCKKGKTEQNLACKAKLMMDQRKENSDITKTKKL